MYLLDTSVVCAFRRRRTDPRLLIWLDDMPDDALFLSVVTLAEIQSGIEPLFVKNPGRAVKFENWANAVAASPKIIPIDDAIARLAVRWRFEKPFSSQANLLIGATAALSGLIIVTLIPEYFKHLGVLTSNLLQLDAKFFQNKR